MTDAFKLFRTCDRNVSEKKTLFRNGWRLWIEQHRTRSASHIAGRQPM